MCEHQWIWNYKTFEEDIQQDENKLGIPVICSICGAEGIEWYNYQDVEITKEMRTFDVYTLSQEDINAVAEHYDQPLEGLDLDDVAHYINKGIHAALDNRDEIIREAIRMARKDRK